jgi:hypothetical protein
MGLRLLELRGGNGHGERMEMSMMTEEGTAR